MFSNMRKSVIEFSMAIDSKSNIVEIGSIHYRAERRRQR